MELHVDKLISNYTITSQKIQNLFSNVNDPADATVRKLDKKLQLAFNDLISAKLDNQVSHIRRVNFLISLMKNMEFSNGIVAQMLDTIRQDINSTNNVDDENQVMF